MPYFGGLNHLAPPQRGSSGPSSSIGENFMAVWDQQRRVDAAWSVEAELSDLYAQNLARAAEVSGRELTNPFGEGMGGWQFLRDVTQLRLGGPRANEVMQNYPWVRDFEELETQLAELNAENPEIKTFDQLVEDLVSLRAAVEENTQSVSERGGALGALAGFAGGMAGSFTNRDPDLLASLAVPGGGATFMRRMLTDAALGAGIEAGVQFGSIQPTREMLGEDPTNPWVSIAFAGAGSAAFRGAIEGTPRAFRAAEARLFPERARARTFAQELDAAPLTNRQVLQRTESVPLTPTQRAARFELEGHALLAETPMNNPRFAREDTLRVWREFEGLPDVPRAATAVDQFLDQNFARIAEEAPEAALGRIRDPELYTRLDDAQARVAEAEARISELELAAEQRTMADAVGLLDESSGARVRAIEEELARPGTSAARRADLEQELDMIVESIGPERLARAESDARIAPRHELRNARRAARSARQERNRLVRDTNEFEARLEREEFNQQRGVLEPTVRQRAVEFNQRLEAEEPQYHAQAETIIENARASEGEVDIGGVTMREDFSVTMDEAGNAMTVRQVLDDLAEDDALLNAMRTCAI